VARLVEPAPDAQQRELLFRAALRAPDHGQMHPWRFLTVEGEARERLGQLFVDTLLARDPAASQVALDKARSMPLRAPLLVVVIARLREHPKVPPQEQLLAAGCAAHGIVLAAHAQGLGAMWRSGEMCHSPEVIQGLGVGPGEEIIGFIYLGSVQGPLRAAGTLNPEDFVSAWRG
jgi:nitroreductase